MIRAFPSGSFTIDNFLIKDLVGFSLKISVINELGIVLISSMYLAKAEPPTI